MPRKINFIFSIVILVGLVLGLISPFSTISRKNSSRKSRILTANAKSVAASNQIYLPLISKPSEPAWPMAGANPQRTSWTPEEVRGKLYPHWYKPFEPYILPKIQVIAASNTLYISTANGLYALDAESGAEKWVYPTEMPLGHSPTIEKGVAYVGGFDHKIHAINAHNGQGLWTFEGGAGFDTNPLVVDGKVYVGNRDGWFYAIYTQGPETGQLAWKYQTGGPIHFSAAYQDGVVYFASNDSHAYALDADLGTLVWKSAKLPGAGFHSWWPVIYEDWVIFAGSNNYRTSADPGPVTQFTEMELEQIYPNHKYDPRGTLAGSLGTEPGDWVSETPTIDVSKSNNTANGSTKPITEYFEEKPWRRTYFVLDGFSGREYTTDFDNDQKPEYAPVLWTWTHSGNRYPPIVGSEGVLYQQNNYMSDEWIAGGQLSGWQLGTPYISVVSSNWAAVDETYGYAGGGDLIYWAHNGNGDAGAFDISIPNTKFADRYISGFRPPTGGYEGTREWIYYTYDLDRVIPGFSPGEGVYGGMEASPPIPYKGKIYIIRGNGVIAFSPGISQVSTLAQAPIVTVQDNVSIPNFNQLQGELIIQVQNMLRAGHLKPGYVSSGILDLRGRICMDDPQDYWHNPSETIYTLIRALPYLPADLQQATRTYIQSEFQAYPPYEYNHIGWKDGASRELFDLPPEVGADMVNYPPQGVVYGYLWRINPFAFYSLWKYAQEFGNAGELLTLAQANSRLIDSFLSLPSDQELIEKPHILNAYIAGYLGYLELQNSAGYDESVDIRTEYNRLLNLRVDHFNSGVIYPPQDYCNAFYISRNFIYLVPELAQHLHDNTLPAVRNAIDTYDNLAPYWFVSKAEVAYREGVIRNLYDYHAIFQARARVLQDPRAELSKYLDVPAVAVGDLYYIQNLVACLEASP